MKDRKLRKALGYKEGVEISLYSALPGICSTPKTKLKRVDEIDAGLNYFSGRLEAIEGRLSQLQNQPIGEVYSNSNLKQTQVNANTWEWKITYNGDEGYWTKFSQKDIDDRVNGKIKINGNWHDKKNCVFYNDIDKEKKKVEKRLNNRR